MKTRTTQSKIKRETHVIDANGLVLGRVSAQIVKLLMGKHRVDYSQHQDSGDFVVVKNVSGLKTTGTKEINKVYEHFSQYPGGLKTSTLRAQFSISPARVLRRAVERMLPRNYLRHPRIKRLIIEGETGSKRIW